MTDAQSETEARFQLPDDLSDENITDQRRKLLQLLLDHPRKGQKWYNSNVGASDGYLQVMRSRYDGIIRKIDTGNVRHGSKQYVYELTDQARAALLREGVIEGDNIDQMEARSEEPSQRIERGNAAFEGVPLDLTGDSPGIQSIKDRPASKQQSAENGDRSNGHEEVEEVEDDEADESPETLTVELDPSDAFGLVHTADPQYARALWRAVTETDE